MSGQRFYADEDWTHGLSCGDCGAVFVPGQEIFEKPDGVIDGIDAVVLICSGCSAGLSRTVVPLPPELQAALFHEDLADFMRRVSEDDH